MCTRLFVFFKFLQNFHVRKLYVLPVGTFYMLLSQRAQASTSVTARDGRIALRPSRTLIFSLAASHLPLANEMGTFIFPFSFFLLSYILETCFLFFTFQVSNLAIFKSSVDKVTATALYIIMYFFFLEGRINFLFSHV